MSDRFDELDEFDELTHYDVLQVSPTAEPAVIDAAYRRLAQKYHPDVSSATDSTTLMAMINAAYHVLRDPARRAEYDAELRRREEEDADLAPGALAGETDAVERPEADRPPAWRTRLGLAAVALIVASLGVYFLTEDQPRSSSVRRLSGPGATAQPIREEPGQSQPATAVVLVEPLATAGRAASVLLPEAATPEAADRSVRATATTEAANAEATRSAFALAAQRVEEEQVARAAATSEALAALATREAESARARREAIAAEATASETTRQAAALEAAQQALAAADAALEGRGRAAVDRPPPPPPQPVEPAPEPVEPRPIVEQPRACADSQQIEVLSPLLQPIQRAGAVVYFGRAVVRNTCNYPLRIQLDFSATGRDGRVLLNGLTSSLLLAPGETRSVDEPIGALPTHQVASFVVRPSVSEAP